MSIPKKIHYLWLSEKKNPIIERCLASWREHLSGYEIVEWNGSNFPFDDFLFAREAFQKKMGFCNRLFSTLVLEKFGGIYMDADVTLNNNFDAFLAHKLFVGTEFTDQIAAHVIGSEVGYPFIKRCLSIIITGISYCQMEPMT